MCAALFHLRDWAAAVSRLGFWGGEHLQDFNVSGPQEKNLSTDQACQAEAVNVRIAFVPRPKSQGDSLQLPNPCYS
jgi:hypothetical protein